MWRFREQTLSSAGFYNTIGFNDDTRAFMSIPARHDVARRVDCAALAKLVAEAPNGRRRSRAARCGSGLPPAEEGLPAMTTMRIARPLSAVVLSAIVLADVVTGAGAPSYPLIGGVGPAMTLRSRPSWRRCAHREDRRRHHLGRGAHMGCATVGTCCSAMWPKNRIYRWSERDGLSVFLEPSGYAGPDDGSLREPGANGLQAEPQGTVLLADSGSRSIARLDPRTKKKQELASRFEGHRFNSPNDIARRSDGVVFFTDPPYGLKDIDRSPVRELSFSGVFRLDLDGSVHLIDDGLKYPNGVVLSPDGQRLYVANSDPARPIWMVYALDARGNVTEKHQLADASDLVRAGGQGNPDGMCMAADGRLFASAPGGLLVMDAEGRRLGRIETGSVVSNCEFGDDGPHALHDCVELRCPRARAQHGARLRALN